MWFYSDDSESGIKTVGTGYGWRPERSRVDIGKGSQITVVFDIEFIITLVLSATIV